MTERADATATIRVDDLEITPGEGLVRAGGRVLTLSVREFQLLVAMVEHAGGIVGRAELCRAVWGRELRPGDRSVDVYVSKLRAKLEHAVPSAATSTPIRASATASSPSPRDGVGAGSRRRRRGRGRRRGAARGRRRTCTNLVDAEARAPTDAEERCRRPIRRASP